MSPNERLFNILSCLERSIGSTNELFFVFKMNMENQNFRVFFTFFHLYAKKKENAFAEIVVMVTI